jgi:uncharacterized protein (TIGR00290 family)
MVAGIVPMDSKKKITISWSGGKDSAFALNILYNSSDFEVVSLHTVIDQETRRVGLHGVRESLIEAQARALNLPLKKVYLPASTTHAVYEECIKNLYEELATEGVTHIMFGDIFLEDLRVYREGLLMQSGLIPVYPVWKLDSTEIIKGFIERGFKTILCSVNETCFKANLLGSTIADQFLQSIPENVDPCGENGEFHTFVFAGPIFQNEIEFDKGEVVAKDYSYKSLVDGKETENRTTFYFQDLKPLTEAT